MILLLHQVLLFVFIYLWISSSFDRAAGSRTSECDKSNQYADGWQSDHAEYDGGSKDYGWSDAAQFPECDITYGSFDPVHVGTDGWGER